jgi:hypothetical protein
MFSLALPQSDRVEIFLLLGRGNGDFAKAKVPLETDERNLVLEGDIFCWFPWDAELI